MSLTLVLVDEKDSARQATLRDFLRQGGSEGGVDPYVYGDVLSWLIEVDGVPVGYTDAHAIDWIARRCRGAIWILPLNRRQGFAASALRQRNSILFDVFNINRIECSVEVNNHVSQKMVESLGYRREGLLRSAGYYDGSYHDFFTYGLLRFDRVNLRAVEEI